MQDKQLPSSVTRVGYNLYRWQLPLSPIDAGDAPEPSTAPVDGSSAAPPPASSVELAALSKPSHGAGTVVGVPGDAVAAGMPVAWPSSRDAAEGSPRMDASPRVGLPSVMSPHRCSSLDVLLAVLKLECAFGKVWLLFPHSGDAASRYLAEVRHQRDLLMASAALPPKADRCLFV